MTVLGSSPRKHGRHGLSFVSVFFVLPWLCLGWSVDPAIAQGGVQEQRWEVHADSGRVTVGDPVTVHFRLRLDERDLLFDTLPKPVDSLDGVRIVSVDKLQRQANREFVGKATLAFYRTGPQPVPVFGLPFMRAVKGISKGTVRSDTLSIEVEPVLAAGNPALRDIRELKPSRLPRFLIGVVALAALALLLAWRRRRTTAETPPAAATAEAVAVPPLPDPYEVALARLGEIEREEWSSKGDVARHYESVTDVLRDYLHFAEEVPARERTTAELFWSLPPRLLDDGLRRQYTAVFEDADLVKFARWRPDAPAATTFLHDARSLLARWHSTAGRPEEETADAVR